MKNSKLNCKELFAYKMQVNHNNTQTLQVLIKYVAYCFIFYMTFLIMGKLAGQTTIAEITVKIFEKIKLKDMISHVITLFMFILFLIKKRDVKILKEALIAIKA